MLFGIEIVQFTVRCAIQQRGNVVRDDQLRIGEGVHQEHLFASGDRDTKIEHGRLHSRSRGQPRPCLRVEWPLSQYIPGLSQTLLHRKIATRIPCKGLKSNV
jgi:hypothetical protein